MPYPDSLSKTYIELALRSVRNFFPSGKCAGTVVPESSMVVPVSGTFEDEVYACIRQYIAAGNMFRSPPGSVLPAGMIAIPDKKLVFHLVPVPFADYADVSPDFFQKLSLEYAGRGVQLVHLWQDQWIKKREIVQGRIEALSGGGKRIYARRTTVRRIRKDEARAFFEMSHLQGYVNARYSYGLFSGGRPVVAASFGAGRTVTRNGVAGRSFELLRCASLPGCRVVGGTGKLIARFVEELHPDDIMTYADLDWASGKSYRALHFRQTAVTPPQMFLIRPDERIRYYPHRLPKETAEAFDQEYIKIYNAGNLKYLLTFTETD